MANRPKTIPNYQGPGRYRHYKGGEYEVLGLGLKEDTLRKPGQPEHDGAGPEIVCVVYRPLSPGSLLEGRAEDFWLRELADFNKLVMRPGEKPRALVPRFVRI
jgi:hypothetical protein